MTIKSYTDLEQSENLAKILPLESADMWYDNDGRSTAGRPEIRCGSFIGLTSKNIPCWSLAALLNILAKQDFIIKSDERNDGYRYNIDIPSRHCKIWFSSLLDAAFEMVCWLKKNEK